MTTIDDDSLYVAITSGHCEGNSYNKITNASTCETAATSLGYTYSNKINDSSGQQICFVGVPPTTKRITTNLIQEMSTLTHKVALIFVQDETEAFSIDINLPISSCLT